MLTARTGGVALLLVALAGCGLRPDPVARPLGSDAPEQPAIATPTATPGEPGQLREQLYFVRDDDLVAVARSAAELSPERALSDLLAGPTPEENARGVTTVLPGTGDLALVEVTGGTAVVELRGELVGNNQVLALAQVVATLDAAPGVERVRFVQDGEPLEVPAGDGAVVSRPVTLQDYRSLLAG